MDQAALVRRCQSGGDFPADAQHFAEGQARAGVFQQLLERFAEDHARVYLRPDPVANAQLRLLAASGARVGAFTDAPEPLARVAAAHLGVASRLEVLEAGPGALERLLATLGPDAEVVQSLDAL